MNCPTCCFSFLWFIILITVSWWIAGISAELYVLLYCFEACCPGLHNFCNLLLQGMQWPHRCILNMLAGNPVCSAPVLIESASSNYPSYEKGTSFSANAFEDPHRKHVGAALVGAAIGTVVAERQHESGEIVTEERRRSRFGSALGAAAKVGAAVVKRRQSRESQESNGMEVHIVQENQQPLGAAIIGAVVEERRHEQQIDNIEEPRPSRIRSVLGAAAKVGAAVTKRRSEQEAEVVANEVAVVKEERRQSRFGAAFAKAGAAVIKRRSEPEIMLVVGEEHHRPLGGDLGAAILERRQTTEGLVVEEEPGHSRIGAIFGAAAKVGAAVVKRRSEQEMEVGRDEVVIIDEERSHPRFGGFLGKAAKVTAAVAERRSEPEVAVVAEEHRRSLFARAKELDVVVVEEEHHRPLFGGGKERDVVVVEEKQHRPLFGGGKEVDVVVVKEEHSRPRFGGGRERDVVVVKEEHNRPRIGGGRERDVVVVKEEHNRPRIGGGRERDVVVVKEEHNRPRIGGGRERDVVVVEREGFRGGRGARFS